MVIETLEEYLKRKKQEDHTSEIETLDSYAKRKNITVTYDYLNKIQAEKDAKNNYDTKKKTYDTALKNYQNSLNKTTAKFPTVTELNKNKLSTNIKDSLSTEKSDLKPVENEETKTTRELANTKLNEVRIARKDYEKAKEDNREVTLFDKTLGVPLRTVSDTLGGFFSPTDSISTRTYKDENGNTKVLPSNSDIKQQHVSENYDTVIGKFLGDVTYNYSKILTAQAVNMVTGGVAGTAIYWADMFNDNLVNTINEGYTKEQALMYSSLSTISEALTEKALGGFSKITPGGTSKMSTTINKSLSKYLKNDRLRSTLSNAFSEGTEEFVQEYIDLINRNLVLNENNRINKEQLDKAIYSGLVGMASGGLSGAMNVEIKTNNTGIIEGETPSNQETSQSSLNDLQNNTLLSTSNTDRFQYKPTLSVKKNNFMASAYKYLSNSQGAIDFVDTVNKVIDNKGYNVLLDSSITNKNGQSVNAKISNVNGEVEIRINPNSPRAGEFLLCHEITHAIETGSMKKLIIDYASKNSEFNTALESLKQTYGTNDVSSEVIADISGQLLGNQEFINSLVMENTTESKTMIQKIYNSIKTTLNKLTKKGRYQNFVQELELKWREAYRSTTTEQAVSNLNNKVSYSIQTDNNGKKFVNVDTNQDIFAGKNLSEQTKIAKKYILDNFRENGLMIDDTNINVTSRTANEYTHPKNKNSELVASSKMKASTELDNLLNIAEYSHSNSDDGRHAIAKDGWDYYKVNFKVGNQTFEGLINIAKRDGIKTLYDITRIKKTSRVGSDNMSTTTNVTSSYVDNISQSNNSVKSDTSSTKYSMQENQNNTQELDNSSFSLKQKQNEIIQKSNPAEDNYHTWIRSVNDIKTFQETLQDSDYKEYYEAEDNFDDSYTIDMVKEALDTGKIKDTGHKVVDNKSKPIQASVSNTNNISQSNTNVKSDTSTKYSMQENQNTTTEQAVSNLNNETLYAKQFQDIILRNKNLNPNSLIPITQTSEKVVQTIQNSKRLQDDFKANIKNGEYKNNATDYVLSLTSETKSKITDPKQGISKTDKEYILRIISANKLPELFADAVYIDTIKPMKSKANNPNELGYHHFVAPINIDGTIYRVLLSGKEKQNSKKLYSLNIEIIPQKKGNAPRVNQYSFKGTSPSEISIADLVQNVKIFNYDTQTWQTYTSSDIKYSMQENQNNTQELDNSSFYLDNKWQEHLEKNYKATGTRTNFKDIKLLPTVEKQNIKILPKVEKEKSNTIKVLPSVKNNSNAVINEKIENNLKTIAELNKAKDESNNKIDLKIKEKRELYQSKKNKNTKLANILQQQAIALENQKKSVEMAYNHRIQVLEERNKKINSKEYRTANQRKNKSMEYREEAEDLIINDIGNFKDKTAGFKYKIETMERSIRDIAPNKEVSQKLINVYIDPVHEATAMAKNFVIYYNKKIKPLNLTKNESIAVQMLGEGKYNGIKPIESLSTAKNILSSINSGNDLKQSAQLYLDAVDFIENNNLDINKIENGIKTFRTIYDNIFNQVNEVLKEQGYKEMDYRKDYFPHFTKEKSESKIGKIMEKLNWKNQNNNIPTDIAGITDQFKPGKIYFKNANRRYGNITEYNALEGIDTYLRGASELIYLTAPIQKLRALENEVRYLHSEKGIQDQYDKIIKSDLDEDSKEEQISQIFKNAKTPLNNFVTELRSYTDNLANKKSELDRRTEHLFNRKIYSTMTNIQNRISANMVGLNISSALTNFIPITLACSQVSTKNLLKAMKSSIANSVKNDGFENNSEFLINRLHKADHLYKTTLDKVADKTGIIFEAVDNFTANVIVRGKYFQNIENGMSKADALKNANAFGRNIMAARDKGSLPTAFNAKNPFIKLFTSFQLEVNNQYSYMLKDLPNDLKDEGVKRLVGAFIKMFLGAYIYNLFSEKITGRKSAFSPADMVIDSIKTINNDNISTYDKLSGITKEIAGEIPFVGGLLGGGRLPISSALPSLPTTAKSVINLSDADKRKTAIRDLAKELSKPLFYIVPPFAGGQAKKTIEGLSMYANKIPGSYTTSGKLRFEAKTDPLSVAQNAIFGQYSSKEARDYFDKGYTSLSEKQQEEFENLNISMETYRNYLSDLTAWNNIKADKDEEGNSISGTALAKKVHEMMNNEKEYSEDDINFYLSKLSDTENPIGFEDIIKIDNDIDVYKYYFSLSRESKDKYISNITNFKFNQNKYIESIKEIKNISKKYSELSKTTDNQQQKTNISNQKKNEIWKYIQNLGLSKVQKIILYAQSGYSITQYKSYMHDYINDLNISKSEKEKIWKELF